LSRRALALETKMHERGGIGDWSVATADGLCGHSDCGSPQG